MPAGPQNLIVDVRPQSAFRHVGGSIAFLCNVQSTPAGYRVISIQWSRGNGKPLPASSRLATRNTFLSIDNLALDDRGVYTCTIQAEALQFPFRQISGTASTTLEVGSGKVL